MNNATFAGRLGRDAELREANGKPVCNFSVAVDDYKGGEKGTLWVGCALWNERAKKLAPFLVKGQSVTVSGRVGVRQYQTRDGEHKAEITLMVNDVTLQGGKPEGFDMKAAEAKALAETPASRPAIPADDPSDDIPFSFAYALPAGLLAWAVYAVSATPNLI